MPATLGFETDDSGYPPIADYDAYIMKRFLSGFYFAEDGPEASMDVPGASAESVSDAAPVDITNAQVAMDAVPELGSYGLYLPEVVEPAQPAPEAQTVGEASHGGIGGLLIRFLDAAKAAEQNLIAALEAEQSTFDQTVGLAEEGAVALDLSYGQDAPASFEYFGGPLAGQNGPSDDGAAEQGADDALAFSDVIDGLESLANFTLSPGEYVL